VMMHAITFVRQKAWEKKELLNTWPGTASDNDMPVT